MRQATYAFTPPRTVALQWLLKPGRIVTADTAKVLLGELFAAPSAVIAGVVNALTLNVAALAMHTGQIFAWFIVLDLALAWARIAVVRRAVRLAAEGLPTQTDLYVITAASWCALQGAMAFTAMRTGILPLQILAATTIMGLIGPICARNYAAPRYALLLVLLCDLPFVAGAALSGELWLLLLVLQTPLFLFGVATIIKRFQALAIANLEAERESRHRARHDPLTGLLNRLGLMERLDELYASASQDFTLFYLDLDGFKQINDQHGHQAGDEILRAVGDRLRSRVRPRDIVSRLGGDELVIVAPEMSPFEGSQYAEGLIRLIADQAYSVASTDRSLRIGLSIGFACFPEDGPAGEDLHRKADAALYQAKAAGKGVHRRFNSSSPVASPTALAG